MNIEIKDYVKKELLGADLSCIATFIESVTGKHPNIGKLKLNKHGIILFENLSIEYKVTDNIITTVVPRVYVDEFIKKGKLYD